MNFWKRLITILKATGKKITFRAKLCELKKIRFEKYTYSNYDLWCLNEKCHDIIIDISG